MRLEKNKKAGESPNRQPAEGETLGSESPNMEEFLYLYVE